MADRQVTPGAAAAGDAGVLLAGIMRRHQVVDLTLPLDETLPCTWPVTPYRAAVWSAALLGSVATSRSGIASGTLNTARQAGSVIGVALFGSLAAGSLVSGLHLALVISIALALAAAALSRGIGILARDGAH